MIWLKYKFFTERMFYKLNIYPCEPEIGER